MKRTFTYLLIFFASLSYNYTEAQLNTSVPANVCLGGTTGTCNALVTAVQPGATTYTWVAIAGGGSSASITQLSGGTGTNVAVNFTTCGAYTITCTAYNGVSIVGTPVIKYSNVSCLATPTVIVSSGTNICAGGGFNLSATGATNYTWVPGNFTASNFTVFPIANICYTVLGSNGSGCTGTAVSCATVAPVPTVQVTSPPPIICLGSNAVITASGANSYIWSTGATTASISVSPSAPTCYSVVGTTNGCTNQAVSCVIVNPTPNLTITAAGNTVCAGDAYNLVAMGANSYTWSNGLSSPIVVLYPLSNTCYSVLGTNSFGCTDFASVCVTVAAVPTVTVPATTTVCLGSSFLLTANGANSYQWNTGQTTASISLIPTVTACYSVVGMAVNGCTNMATGCVLINNTCSDVWPGDANTDGIVDNSDVFEIGLAFSNTGPARSPGGNAYVSQFANNWTGTISTGRNKCFADCNGDGTVNNGDTLAIYNNYSLTHAFKPLSPSSVGDINIVAGQNYVSDGQWSKADIMLGTSASPLSQLYGVAYDINFDKSVIETDEIYVVYGPSFLNTPVQNVNFRKTIFNSEIIHTASVRTNGTNVNGDGKIGELWFKVKSGIAAGTPLNFSVSNAKKIGVSGIPVSLTGGSTVLSVENYVGLESITSLKNTTSLFPNPAAKKLNLQSSLGSEVQYAMVDLTGRQIIAGVFINSKILDLSEYAAGAYLIRFESGSETLYKKLVIEK